jgi:hypothetical protein
VLALVRWPPGRSWMRTSAGLRRWRASRVFAVLMAGERFDHVGDPFCVSYQLAVAGRQGAVGGLPGRVGRGRSDRGFAGAFGPSVPRTWVTGFLTVGSVTARSWAMRWFDLPAAAAFAGLRLRAGAR